VPGSSAITNGRFGPTRQSGCAATSAAQLANDSLPE
jgi:hypothetical protein